MHRIDGDGAVAVIPTPESVGSTVGYFQKGNPGTGTRATQVTADWCNAIQEEIAGAIENKGISLDKTNRGQLKMAIARRKIRSVINSNLTIDPADLDELFLVSTGDSNRTISLPPASEMVGVGMKFIKVDDGVGSVELVPHDSETINGSPAYIIRAQYGFLTLISNGTSWVVIEISPDQEEIDLDCTGVGDFTGGAIKLVRQGRFVTMHRLENITWVSSSNPSSGDGFIPQRFRPVNGISNVYYLTNSSGILISYTLHVTPAGAISYRTYNIETGAERATISTGTSHVVTWVIDSANYQPNVGPL